MIEWDWIGAALPSLALPQSAIQSKTAHSFGISRPDLNSSGCPQWYTLLLCCLDYYRMCRRLACIWRTFLSWCFDVISFVCASLFARCLDSCLALFSWGTWGIWEAWRFRVGWRSSRRVWMRLEIEVGEGRQCWLGGIRVRWVWSSRWLRRGLEVSKRVEKKLSC